MDGLFTIIPRSISKMLLERGASGVERAVIDALAHHRGDGGEIGVSKGGYVMSASDVCDYYDGVIDVDSVRHALSRMVKKGILVRSRRVKRGNAWLTVYAFAPHDEPDDSDGDGDDAEPHESHLPMTESPWVDGFTHDESFMGPMTNPSCTPISTPLESSSASKPTSYSKSSRLESFSGKNDRRPKYEYPIDGDEVCDYMEESYNIPEYLDAMEVAEKFFEYNESRGWMVDGMPMHDWHAALEGFVRHVDGCVARSVD